jgi:hypothetical protein
MEIRYLEKKVILTILVLGFMRISPRLFLLGAVSHTKSTKCSFLRWKKIANVLVSRLQKNAIECFSDFLAIFAKKKRLSFHMSKK